MAKRRARQQRIPGTFDQVTEALNRKAEQYAETLYARMAQQKRENTLKADLIEMMRDADVLEFEHEGYKVKLEHKETDKLTVKKLREDAE